MKNETINIVFLLAALGQIILALSMTMPRLKIAPVYVPLSLFFISSGISFSVPAINTLSPELTYYSLFIFIPCIVLQPVALWLYVSGLCSPIRWTFNIGYWPHFIPFFIGVSLSIYMMIIPKSVVTSLFVEQRYPSDNNGITVMTLFFILFIAYLLQSTLYMVSISKRLLTYQHQLKILFSSNEKRELVWLVWVITIIGMTWLLALLNLLPTLANYLPIAPLTLVCGSYFIMIWTLCLWGLRQKPGFHDRYIDDKDILSHNQSTEISEVLFSAKTKYQRSALKTEQSKSIAKKLDTAMQHDHLYLNANLSLPELAKQLVVPANYLSQTLNEHLNVTFFDYINRWRIEHAKSLLNVGELSTIDVAMESGFNAKSSFYKAFKHHAGLTPGQFKISN